MCFWNTITPNSSILYTKSPVFTLHASLPVTNGLRTAFTNAEGVTDIPVQMAAVAVVSFPLFLVFVFLRKYIMKGVSRRGIKG